MTYCSLTTGDVVHAERFDPRTTPLPSGVRHVGGGRYMVGQGQAGRFIENGVWLVTLSDGATVIPVDAVAFGRAYVAVVD